MKAGRQAMYRKLKKAQNTILKQCKQIKSLQRQILRWNSKTKLKANHSPPRDKINQILQGNKVADSVKKKLIFNETICDTLIEKIKSMSAKEKQVVDKLLYSEKFQQSNLCNVENNLVNSKMLLGTGIFEKPLLEYERETRSDKISAKCKGIIEKFFLDDVLSKVCPGKKDIVKHEGKIEQKRRLLYPVNYCYARFCERFDSFKIGYVKFLECKPWWVAPQKVKDRDTCARLPCENFKFLVERLHNLRLLKSSVPLTVCKIKGLEININEENESMTCEFFQWEKVLKERVIRGKTKEFQKMEKVKRTCCVKELLGEFFRPKNVYVEHMDIVFHQLGQLKKKREKGVVDELNIQVDFAENYESKYTSEVQTMHFGANKAQMSIHTGVAYNNGLHSSFATISDNTDHKAHTVWAHLLPILLWLAEQYPNVNTIIFFSDGPTSQYKNRFNIFLCYNVVKPIFNHLKFVSWNWSASGHGKGPQDGVGAVIKRNADSAVCEGLDIDDIVSAESLVRANSSSSLKVDLVDLKAMDFMQTKVLGKIPAIPRIQTTYQITWAVGEDKLYLRRLSCFTCPFNQVCEHFPLGVGFLNYPPVWESHLEAPLRLIIKRVL
ncbi:unnamed protein product [Bemisia tabaci]|uniref:Uncharacterized protein n=1 Tax=Bemisia tabaci TaxID=7038 RepID=A0A9P0ANZ7_BEMTA|nr:unnamed protein product [Bemisia tabaci]